MIEWQTWILRAASAWSQSISDGKNGVIILIFNSIAITTPWLLTKISIKTNWREMRNTYKKEKNMTAFMHKNLANGLIGVNSYL